MIRNLYRLGKALQKEEKYRDYFAPWQNPFPNVDADKAKVIYFHIVDSKLVGTHAIEPFKPALVKNYLYRKPKGANGAPLVPTDYFYPSGKEKDHAENVRKLMSRLSRAFPNGKSLFFASQEHKELALNEIEAQLLAFSGNIDDRYLITFRVNGQWLGEFPENIALFEAEAYSKYYDKSQAKDHVCALTYEPSPEVWGRIDTLGFTVNDLTFSRGGFNPSDSFRMFPASPEAAKTVEGALRYVKANLTRSFYSLRYFIVPHFIEGKDEVMTEVVESLARSSQEDNDFNSLSRSIFNNERIIADIIEENRMSRQGIFYDILFFQINQAQFAIKIHLTDILPSRFSQIFKAKHKIENRYKRINQIYTKKEVIDFFVTFSRIQRYFSSKANNEVIFHPLFYRILEAVFYGQSLDELSIIRAFAAEIQQSFKQRREDKNRYIFRTKDAFALWHFFLELNLFNYKNRKEMEDKPVPLTLDEFIQAHPEFFAAPYKKAAFFMGCLTELLLQAQRERLKNEPFLEKLSGLNLDDHDLRVLFPRLQEKMTQYKDHIYNYEYSSNRGDIQRLRAEIAQILMEPSNVGRAEISFAFSAGLVMQKEFTQHQINLYKAKGKITAED